MWEWPNRYLDERTLRFYVATETRFLSWAEVLALWIDAPSFSDAFSEALAAVPWAAFRWETRPLIGSDFAEPFEFVVIDSPDLIARPDPAPFAEHLRHAGRRTIVEFDNLGGDARMVVPCPLVADDAYTHLARFVRFAPKAQQRELWREVGLAMERRAGDIPVWLNTAGAGVAWLHVRLDDRPKYYAHAPYTVVTTG